MPKLKYYQALTRALREEMARDPSVVLIGEDVGPSGGIFAQTRGLHAAFGPLRVRDTPIAENGFVSAAVGAAMTGLRPVVEIGFGDFLTCCMDPLVNQAAKLRYMLGGQVGVPLVLYTFAGGGLSAGPQHSQSLEAWFAHVPGLKVIMPATADDLLGMMKSAIRDDDPVIALLGKKLIGSSAETPDGEHLVPLGKALVRRAGGDLTLATLGQMVPVALQAAQALAGEGIEVEVVDLRTVSPLDHATVAASLERTGHLLVVQEAMGPCGIGGEVVSQMAERHFGLLKAAPRRVSPPFAPSPFAPELEALYLPSAAAVAAAALEVLGRRRAA